MKTISLMKNIIHRVEWSTQKRKIPVEELIIQYDLEQYDNILIIIPHADDELIGCHQLLKKYSSKITLCFCDYIGSNTTVENRLLRQREFINFVNYMNINYFICTDVINDLSANLIKIRYDLIMTPSYIDWHEEHRKVNDILYNFILKNKSIKDFSDIGWYQISVPIVNVNNAGLPYTGVEVKEMIKLFKKYYVSQQNVPIHRFVEIRKLISMQNSIAVENFYIMSSNEFCKNIQILRKEDFNKLKKEINNIYYLWKESILCYNKLSEYTNK